MKPQPACATAVESLLSGQGQEIDSSTSSPLIAELLKRSAENKEKNDAERRDYTHQYSGYFDVSPPSSFGRKLC
jgi:hypothetical protein